MGVRLAALAWGFAEATLFFIVPDVALSAVALRDRGPALRCCLWALGGALVGGALMYGWALHSPDTAVTAVGQVPAVSAEMLARVESGLAATGSWAMFLGPLTGTPYKLYAVLSPAAGIGLPVFLLVSVPARLIRFVLVVLVTSLIDRMLSARLSYRVRLGLLLAFWAVFYGVFFAVMG